MSEDNHLFTCELCGEGNMNETAMQTHMYIAHVYNEISCMFCDLRGVTAEEMTIHVNSVHCSDDSYDNGGLQNSVDSGQSNTENYSTDEIQTTRLPVTSMLCDRSNLDLVDSRRAYKPDCSNVFFTTNYNAETGSQHVPCHESSGNVCEVSRDKHEKRKLSDALVPSGSRPSSKQEKTDSLPVYFSSYSGAEVTTNCCTSLSSSSTSLSLPKTTDANGVDRAYHGDRFVEHNYCCCT